MKGFQEKMVDQEKRIDGLKIAFKKKKQKQKDRQDSMNDKFK